MRRLSLFSLTASWIFTVILVAPARAGQPRFALEPGLELRYAVKLGDWFDGEGGKLNIPRESDGSPKYEKSELTIYVLGQQLDGSFRVLMHRTSEASAQLYTWADLFPDGQLNLIPSVAPNLEFDSLRTIFPLLPKDDREKKAGWEEVEPRTDLRMRFSFAEEIIKAECDSPLDRVSLGHWTIRYRLDSRTNLPSEIKTDGRWDRYNETHSVIVTVKDILHHDKEWVAKFSTNATKYFEAIAKQKRFQQSEVMDLAIAEREQPGAAGEMLDARKASLIATRDAVAESLFRADLDRRIKQCDEYRKSRVEAAQHWAKFAGLPAPEWKVADLDGIEHSLQQYRGKVVVLDFWFRQCSFCIRAMPQVGLTAATFRQENAPVSFFGVSIDKVEADAKFVADTMKLTYPVLRSEALAEQLGVASYPTLLVIAPDGKVQGIFVGHNLALREELTTCIRKLLKK
jgi:peroxiredoxin